MESNTFSFQTLRQGVHTFHLVHTVSHILVKRFLDLRFHCQYAGLKRYFLHLILIYHLNKFVISDLAGVTAHHICHEAETHQRNKETNQKSQNGLAVSVRSPGFSGYFGSDGFRRSDHPYDYSFFSSCCYLLYYKEISLINQQIIQYSRPLLPT